MQSNTHAMSPETFQRIVASLRFDEGQLQEERRAHPRIRVAANIDVICRATDQLGARMLRVWLRDLSVCGIGLTSPAWLPQGQDFVARLPQENTGFLNIAYRVSNARFVPGGLYCIGAKLVRVGGPKPSRPATD